MEQLSSEPVENEPVARIIETRLTLPVLTRQIRINVIGMTIEGFKCRENNNTKEIISIWKQKYVYMRALESATGF